MLETIFMQITCLHEARIAEYSDTLFKKIQIFEKLRIKYADQTLSQAGVELPLNVVAFKQYEQIFERCFKLGLVAYLISNSCSDMTSNLVMEALSEHHINKLIQQCQLYRNQTASRHSSIDFESTQTEPSKYLKAI